MGYSANKAYIMGTKKKGGKVVLGGNYDIGIILAGGVCMEYMHGNNIGRAIRLPDKPFS